MSNSLRLEVILATLDRASAPLRAIARNSGSMAAAVNNARAKLRDLDAQNKRIDTFRKLARDVSVTSTAMQAAQQKVAQLAREMRATDSPTKAMVRNFEAAKREAAQLKDRNAQLTAQQQRLRTELTAAGVPLRGLAQYQAELRMRTAAATEALERQSAALRDQAAHAARLRGARDRYDAMLTTRDRIAGAGAAALGAGGGVLYTAARAVQPGIEFDRTMSKVQSLARLEKDSEAMRALRQQARDLGATTMFDAVDAAQGQAFLAMAGFTPEAIRAAMPGLLDTALAGDTELGRTADIASNILSQFALDPSAMGNVSDVLVGAFTRSNTSLEQLGETMKYAGTVAEGLAFDLETTAAMAGMLGNAGLQGSMAGTSLRAIMSRMAAPPKMAREALDELGVSALDAAGNMRPIEQILADIHARTAGMGNAQRAGYFKAIAGEEAFTGLSYLVDRAGTGELQAFIEALRNSAGEAQRVAARMADNITGDLDELSSAWDDLRITLFETNNGAMRETTQWMTRIVARIGAWMAANPELVATLSKIAIVTAAGVAAFGALAVALAAMIGPFAVLRYGMALFGIQGAVWARGLFSLARGALPAVGAALRMLFGLMLTNPIGLAITGIATAAYLIYQHWEPIAAWFSELWGRITGTFDNAVTSITGVLAGWNPLEVLPQMVEAAIQLLESQVPPQFMAFGRHLVNSMVSGITGTMGRAREAISNVGDSVVGWFKEKLGIHSPSRVFASLGGYTMQGLAQGLTAEQRGPLAAVSDIARKLVTAAGVGLAGMSYAAAPGGTFQAVPGTPAGPSAGATYNITINAAPGMDERAVARLVLAEIERRENRSAAQRRSRLADLE